MKWAEVSILTTHEATDVVAEIYHDIGAQGVVIEDPELLNSYIDSGMWEFSDILSICGGHIGFSTEVDSLFKLDVAYKQACAALQFVVIFVGLIEFRRDLDASYVIRLSL